jgi:UPF0755 protein
MSRSASTDPHDDSSGGTPPHGAPPVSRAASADSAPADSAPADSAPADSAPADSAHDEPVGGGRGDRGSGRRGRLTRRGRWAVTLFAVALVLAGLLAWYEVEAHPFGRPGKAVQVDVRAGEPLGAIETALATHQVVGTAVAFRIWSFVHGDPLVRPGVYQLHRNLSFSAAKAALDAGPNVFELTVAPGMTISEIDLELESLPGNLVRGLSDAGAGGHVRSPFQLSSSSLEGLIGAGTYRILPGETGHELLAQMVSRFDAEAAAAGLSTTTTVGGLDAYQLVTVASIVQKEGYYTRYMGDVARVVFNRLAAGMRLDMTSTVLYSLGKDGGPVTPQEEQVTTPYNTYLHAGLTPTPICTPSVQALRAAVDPPAGAWLYFDLVTAKSGIMKFASTYTGQLALEREAAANVAKRSKQAGRPSSGSSPGPSA